MLDNTFRVVLTNGELTAGLELKRRTFFLNPFSLLLWIFCNETYFVMDKNEDSSSFIGIV